MVRGLLETEPLHFTCIAASDGTRIERADFTGNGLQNNLVTISTFHASTPTSGGTKKEDVELLPVVMNSMFDVAGPSSGGGGGGGTKKEDIEMIINEFGEGGGLAAKEKLAQGSNNVQDVNNKNAVLVQGVYEMMCSHADKMKSEEDFSKLSEQILFSILTFSFLGFCFPMIMLVSSFGCSTYISFFTEMFQIILKFRLLSTIEFRRLSNESKLLEIKYEVGSNSQRLYFKCIRHIFLHFAFVD